MAAGNGFTTRRILLRRWTDADREPFAAINADPVVMEYFPAPLERAESDGFVDRIEAQFDAWGFGLWVLERRVDRAFLGFTGLAPVRADIPPAGAIEVGWRLSRSAWGQGYATEAAREALRVGFGEGRLSEIVALTAVVNAPSRRVMERLGMRHDPADDFDHLGVPPGPLRRHALYRLDREQYNDHARWGPA